MKVIDFDSSFLEKIKKIRYQYEDIIPLGIYHYYDDILSGNNLELYMQSYSLSKEELLRFARICKVLNIYNELFALIGVIQSEVELLESDELLEYQDFIAKLQGEGEQFIHEINSIDGSSHFNSSDSISNILIYPKYIFESKLRTSNAHSGREEQTQKRIANLLEQLRFANYMTLRQKGLIHQGKQISNNKPCYIDGNAFERIGLLTTKVGYLRISVSENNKDYIKNAFDIDFDTLYLVVYFGDFKNEAVGEKRFYSDMITDLNQHEEEILSICQIFKNDFTKDTLSIALDFLHNGFQITDELTSISKNKANSNL